MRTKKPVESDIGRRVKAALAREPGLSVKDVAEKLKLNRQFMAGFLTALEERGDIFHRSVGPARIYFVNNPKVT